MACKKGYSEVINALESHTNTPNPSKPKHIFSKNGMHWNPIQLAAMDGYCELGMFSHKSMKTIFVPIIFSKKLSQLLAQLSRSIFE